MVNYLDKGIPKKLWIEESLWRIIKRSLPLSCVDIIFQRKDGSILYGFRIIAPYKNAWSLIGGRLLYKESLQQAAVRIAREYGLKMDLDQLYLNGVFPVSFADRSDVAISLATFDPKGRPEVDGIEFSEFAWMKGPPKHLSANYIKMLSKWRMSCRSEGFLKLNKL